MHGYVRVTHIRGALTFEGHTSCRWHIMKRVLHAAVIGGRTGEPNTPARCDMTPGHEVATSSMPLFPSLYFSTQTFFLYRTRHFPEQSFTARVRSRLG